MPLIRYRIGDRGALATPTPCECGRQLPALATVEGRIDDVLYTTDGRVIGRLDPVFKGRLPIREAQIVQESLNRVRVRYVPAPDFHSAALESMTARLRDRLGPVQVVSEIVSAIRTEPEAGRGVIAPAAEERARLRQSDPLSHARIMTRAIHESLPGRHQGDDPGRPDRPNFCVSAADHHRV